jgi:hypothetical protein
VEVQHAMRCDAGQDRGCCGPHPCPSMCGGGGHYPNFWMDNAWTIDTSYLHPTFPRYPHAPLYFLILDDWPEKHHGFK